MRREDIEKRIAAIAAKCDNEVQHKDEDALHREVLEAIASGEYHGFASDLARVALKTRELDFERWYA